MSSDNHPALPLSQQLEISCQICRSQFNLKLNTHIPLDGVCAIYGHSGSGKTSLLRTIAGLEHHSNCEIRFAGETWQDKYTFVPAHKRRIGYVFQEASLLEHLTVKQNLDYAIKRARKLNQFSYQQVTDLMKIEPLLAQLPSTLSGGEKQRIAIARALLSQPQLLLMDEPLASLDLTHKNEILHYLEKLKTEVDIPIIYISHSPDEVARLADHLLVLDKGRLVSDKPINQSFELLNTATRHINEQAVFLQAFVVSRLDKWQQIKVGLKSNQAGSSPAYLWLTDNGLQPGSELRLKILAKDVSISLTKALDSSIQNSLLTEIEKIEPLDDGMQLITLNASGHLIQARISNKAVFDLKLYAGIQVYAQIKAAALI